MTDNEHNNLIVRDLIRLFLSACFTLKNQRRNDAGRVGKVALAGGESCAR